MKLKTNEELNYHNYQLLLDIAEHLNRMELVNFDVDKQVNTIVLRPHQNIAFNGLDVDNECSVFLNLDIKLLVSPYSNIPDIFSDITLQSVAYEHLKVSLNRPLYSLMNDGQENLEENKDNLLSHAYELAKALFELIRVQHQAE